MGRKRIVQQVTAEAMAARRPRCPQWLPKGAKKVFRDLVAILEESGRLALADQALIASTAEAADELRRAVEALAVEGEVMRFANGNVGQNPWTRIRDSAARRLSRGLQGLGIRPADRPVAEVAAEPELPSFRALEGGSGSERAVGFLGR